MSKQDLLDACVKQISEQGWKNFSFSVVAKETNRPLTDFQDAFGAPADIPQAVINIIDRKMLAEVEGEDFTSYTPRETLFEILMARFDAAAEYKPFIAALWGEWSADMMSALLVASKGLGSMGWVLDRAGLNSRGLSGMMRLQGLTILYLMTVNAWLEDDTDDISKTMAYLDQGLGRVDRIAKALSL